MARLPRLALPGHAHWIIQRGIGGRAAFEDDTDRLAYLAALREAAALEQVRLHAYALQPSAVHLLARPSTAAGLSRMMQAVGRRYVSAHHRRHGGSGTLWDGRFRCAVVEPGRTLIDVLCLIDVFGAAADQGSHACRMGGVVDALLSDPPEYWALGNTPFDRQGAWRQRISDGLPAQRATELLAAAGGGWVVGSAAFAALVGEASARPAAPRPRGRPAKGAA